MLSLKPPAKTERQLKALAASGASGFARAAQAELKRRTLAGLASCRREQPADGEGSSQ